MLDDAVATQDTVTQLIGAIRWVRRMVGSMCRVGAAGDNAAMESFFSPLQKNVLTAVDGTPARTCGSGSSPGSNGATTAADARPLSAG